MHEYTHTQTHTHLCKQLAPLAARPVSCFDNNDTVFIMTFPSDWSQGWCVHSLSLSSGVENRLTWASSSNRMRCILMCRSREPIHEERIATGRKPASVMVWFVGNKKRSKGHTMSHVPSVLLLHCCASPNRDYLENPAVLILKRCRTWHHCGS